MNRHVILAVSLLLTTALLAGCGPAAPVEPPAINEPTATLEPTATPEPPPVEPRTRDIDGMVEVFVPANGTLNPSAFWIDQTEVTIGMYALCVQAGVCEPPIDYRSFERDSYYGNPAYDNYPVLYVPWAMAGTYCGWVGGSLPSDEQWLYAARGADDRTYPWGEDLDGTRANYCDATCTFEFADMAVNDGYSDTAPVGSYPDGASPFGALDMIGNVIEWTSTSADEFIILRGGGWSSPAIAMTISNPGWGEPLNGYIFAGFRCVRATSP